MADVKISQLPLVTTVAPTDISPVVASGATSKITIQNLATSLPLVTSASYALTASYLLGGNPGEISKLTQSTPATTWSFNHNLSEKYPVVTVYDQNNNVVQPTEIVAINSSSMEIRFTVSASGTAVAVVGGTAVSASYAASSSYALTASYALNGGGSGVPFPYTGSAEITGSLTVTGSVSVSGSLTSNGQPVVAGTGSSGQVTFWTGTNSVSGSATFAYTPISQLLVNNAVTASGAIARGVNFTPSLTAAANNDVLVGLDITPTFTNGAFTSVINTAVRATGNINIIGNAIIAQAGTSPFSGTSVLGSLEIGTFNATLADGNLIVRGYAALGGISKSGYGAVGSNYYLSPTNNLLRRNADPVSVMEMQIGGFQWKTAANGAANTSISLSELMRLNANGNLLLGTTTDSGFKLDISGSARISSGLTVTGSTLISSSLTVTGSVSSTSGFTGSLFGTSSWAITASYALNAASATSGLTSQIATGSVTASVNIVSASFQVTSASVVLFSVDRGGAITASRAFLSASNNMASGSTLIVYGSGSAQPVFTVQGSQGELFSVNDALSGSLFSVNDISGLPILEAFSDNRVLIGSYQAPALFTTVRTVSVQGANVIYSVPTASYDAVFFEYSLRSGSNCRAGQIMSIWSGSDTNWTETVTADFGNTTGVAFRTIITGSNMALTGSFPSASWIMKTIVRSV